MYLLFSDSKTMATLVNYKCKSVIKLIPDYAKASQLPILRTTDAHNYIGFTSEQIMWTSLGLFEPFWVTTVHTVTDWFLYPHKNRFGIVWTYPQTVAAFAYVINVTPLFCGSIRDRSTWHRAANRPIFNFPPPMVPSGAGQFNKGSDSLHLVKKWLLPVQQRLFWGGGGTCDFFGGRDWTSVAEREVCNACVRSSFSTFFSFFASKRIITSFKNMSFNDLSSKFFFRTLSSFNGIFLLIFTSLLF